MKLYKIRDWDSLYENNRSRQVKDLSWVPIQNKLDGENFSTIMGHKDGAVIFSAFILMVEVASRCTPRGTLVRGNGLPHDVRSMSAKCRCPDVWFKVGFEYLEQHTDWLIVEDVMNERQEGDVEASGGRQSGDEEQKGTEQNGKNGKEREKKRETTSPKPKTDTVLIIELPKNLQSDTFKASWSDWLKYRRAKKGGIPDWNVFFQKQLKFLSGFGSATAVDMMETSMRQGWTGLFPPKNEQPQPAAAQANGEEFQDWT